jgi:NADH dehydrogenase FAD-containing subunit
MNDLHNIVIVGGAAGGLALATLLGGNISANMQKLKLLWLTKI